MAVMCGIAFLICRLSGNGLFSRIKLRGNCMVESSLISADVVVAETSTTFELADTIIEGIDEEFGRAEERISVGLVESVSRRDGRVGVTNA